MEYIHKDYGIFRVKFIRVKRLQQITRQILYSTANNLILFIYKLKLEHLKIKKN